jgi:hypothetical protein
MRTSYGCALKRNGAVSDIDKRERITTANAEALRFGYRIEVEFDDNKSTYLAMAYRLGGGSKPRPLCRGATALEALEVGVECSAAKAKPVESRVPSQVPIAAVAGVS